MGRHRHHHNHRHEDMVPPIPPIPPISPIPPLDESGWERDFIKHKFRELIGSGRHGFRGSWGPFMFDFGDSGLGGGFRHRGGGGRRARRMFESGELRLVLLKLIADQPRHGYELIKAIEDMTGGEYAPSPGVIYPTLTMLEDMGLIAEKKSNDAKKIFECTADGQVHLADREDEVEELMDRLEELAPKTGSGPGPAIGRAVKNLMTALSHRIEREGLDEELLLEIAAILDEAAQRIERVK